MTHKSLHPEPEVFRTMRPLSQGRTKIWKISYGQSSKMVIGDSIGTLGGGVKRAEVPQLELRRRSSLAGHLRPRT